VSEALYDGEPSSRDERHLGPRVSPAQKARWGWSCVAWSQIFLFLHPASWVGVFRGAFLSLSSFLLCSAIGILWFCMGGGGPSVPSSALGSHRLWIPHFLPRVLTGSSAHLPRFNPVLTCAVLASLVNLGSHGLGLKVQWRLGILPGCFSRNH
jgi:hypothetical protein